VSFGILDVPGHTAGHIAYFAEALDPPVLFCGDTLFACGCGRLFEGTPAQMLASLDRLSELPPATRVYCATNTRRPTSASRSRSSLRTPTFSNALAMRP